LFSAVQILINDFFVFVAVEKSFRNRIPWCVSPTVE